MSSSPPVRAEATPPPRIVADQAPPSPSLDQLLPASEPPSQRYSPPPFVDSHYFDDAFRNTPTPPLSTFLDTILNPAQLDHGRYSPFNYRPAPPHRPFFTIDDMPAITRPRPHASNRPARLPNGYVDLTSTPDTPPQPTQPRRRQSPTPGPSAKRRKRDHDTEKKQESAEPVTVEEVDLTDDKLSIQDTLQKQRQDAVKSLTKPEEPPTTFNNFTCVICMDNPTDLTATACGHLFCHTCLMEALIAGENRTGPGEPKRSQCPVCRKNISRTKANDIIPLLLKKGIATQPRKKVSVVTPVGPTKYIIAKDNVLNKAQMRDVPRQPSKRKNPQRRSRSRNVLRIIESV